MTAPLLVEVSRGGRVESRHEVDAVVVDRHGSIVESWGEAERPVMPRSSAKPLQAIPLITSGAAAAFGVDDAELALACASHNGERDHVDRVLAWLDRLSLGADDLECGTQYPVHEPAFVDLVASGGEAGPEHNNCSGKHTGFLSICRHLDLPTAGY
ncbi:MAG: asparaginase, partial [Acidimicrobiia bacterium]|nr:asparaginase [Acidimicrobiia bacterium]